MGFIKFEKKIKYKKDKQKNNLKKKRARRQYKNFVVCL